MNIDQLWDYSDAAASEARLRDALAACEDGAARMELTTQLARAQGLQQKFEQAHVTLNAVEAHADPLPPRVRIRYLLERGRVYHSSKQADKAKPLFLDAWRLAREAGEDGLAIDAAHMMGIIEPPDEALRWNEQALAIAEGSTSPAAHEWLGALYNNIGWTYHDRGDHGRALELFRKALAWREQKGDPATILIAKWAVARALRSLGIVDEALAIQQALLAENEAAGRRDGYVFEELGECSLLLGWGDQAKGYFALAHAELSKDPWLPRDDPQRLARLQRLAEA